MQYKNNINTRQLTTLRQNKNNLWIIPCNIFCYIYHMELSKNYFLFCLIKQSPCKVLMIWNNLQPYKRKANTTFNKPSKDVCKTDSIWMTLDRRASSLISLDIKSGMLWAGGSGVTLAILAKMLVTIRNTIYSRVRYIHMVDWISNKNQTIKQQTLW